MPTTTFPEWKKEVNRIVEKRIGLSCDDLEDCCYADWYEDGVSPSEAAGKAIRNSGG